MSNLQTRGVMGCFVIERREARHMVASADSGNYTAAQVRAGIGLWGEKAFAPGSPPQRCSTCEHVFNSALEPEAFFLAIPYKGDGDSFVSGVCFACVRRIGSDGLLGRAAAHFKKLWPLGKITGGGLDNRE